MWIEDLLGGITSIVSSAVTSAGQWFFSFFTSEEKIILEWFAPLINQVRDQALKLGNDDLQAGFKILQNAAMASVTAALTAPPGAQAAAAEAAFLQVLMIQGQAALNNAEAAAIKAAVAIVQTKPELVTAIAATAAAVTAPKE